MAESEEHGRVLQRRRTRKAIVEATAALLARGITPTAAEVAAAAEVSRRTVYLYFPRLEQLLVDASLEAATRAELAELEAGPAAGATAGDGSPEAAAVALAEAARRFQRLSAETEAHGRRILRLTLERAGDEPGPGPRRGYRRVEWIEGALAPWRERLSAPAYERLVSALSLLLGWEALIVLRDVRGAKAEEAAALSAWAAGLLVRAALEEGGADPAGGPGGGTAP